MSKKNPTPKQDRLMAQIEKHIDRYFPVIWRGSRHPLKATVRFGKDLRRLVSLSIDASAEAAKNAGWEKPRRKKP